MKSKMQTQIDQRAKERALEDAKRIRDARIAKRRRDWLNFQPNAPKVKREVTNVVPARELSLDDPDDLDVLHNDLILMCETLASTTELASNTAEMAANEPVNADNVAKTEVPKVPERTPLSRRT